MALTAEQKRQIRSLIDKCKAQQDRIDDLEDLVIRLSTPSPEWFELAQRIGVKLTGSQGAMFDLLLARRPRTVTREALLAALEAANGTEPDMKIVDVQMCKLRAKLKGTRIKIRTVWGVGYQLEGVPLDDDETTDAASEALRLVRVDDARREAGDT